MPSSSVHAVSSLTSSIRATSGAKWSKRPSSRACRAIASRTADGAGTPGSAKAETSSSRLRPSGSPAKNASTPACHSFIGAHPCSPYERSPPAVRSWRENLTQFGEGGVEPRFHGADRDPELDRDLGAGQAGEVSEL